jgi:hypothetical protein
VDPESGSTLRLLIGIFSQTSGSTWGSVASLLRSTAPPLYTRVANIFSASVNDAAVWPNPRRRGRARAGGLRRAAAGPDAGLRSPGR